MKASTITKFHYYPETAEELRELFDDGQVVEMRVCICQRGPSVIEFLFYSSDNRATAPLSLLQEAQELMFKRGCRAMMRYGPDPDFEGQKLRVRTEEETQ